MNLPCRCPTCLNATSASSREANEALQRFRMLHPDPKRWTRAVVMEMRELESRAEAPGHLPSQRYLTR